MKEKLLALMERFDGLARRQRLLMAGGAALVVLVLGYLLTIQPQLNRQAAQVKRMAQINNDLATLETQIKTMEAQRSDPDASNRAALQEVRKNMAAIDTRLRNVQDSLVPPDKMQGFLEELLGRNRNLELISLKTLPAEPLIEPRSVQGKQAAQAGDTGLTNIYKHAIEMQVAGNYGDLLAYLEALEAMPQRIVWGRAELVVDKYPRCILKLTVYTLNLDKQWLVV